MADEDENSKMNLVVVGAGAVGKSSLVIRFVIGDFLDSYDPTIEDYYRKLVEVDNEPCYFDILDTAGQEEFASMQDEFFRRGDAFLLVYAVTTRQTFNYIPVLRKKLMMARDDNEMPAIVLVGNKCDLPDKRQVEKSEGEKLAKEWNCPFYETSPKQQVNVTIVFEEAARVWRRTRTQNHATRTRRASRFSVTRCCQSMSSHFAGCCECNRVCQCCANNQRDQEPSPQDLQQYQRRDQDQLAFYKVDAGKIQPDSVQAPILALKNFKIRRRFSCTRFMKAVLCGLFLPLVVIAQTFTVLTYRDEKELCFYKWMYPDAYPYDRIHQALLLDFLGLVVGRSAFQDPDAVKGRAWFLRQTLTQKLQRVMITAVLCVTLLVSYYNASQSRNERLRVSLMESVGPLALFWSLWMLLSFWIAYEPKLYPPMPNTFRLRSIRLYLGESFTHVTDARKFLRAYGWSRDSKWQLPMWHTVVIVLLGLFYASIPGLTRSTVGDPSDGLLRKKFITKREWEVEVGALFVNFLLVFSFVYAIEVQYSKHFDSYREWMYDLTMLLNKTDANIEHGDKDEHYMPQKGRNFSKDIFLSLTRRSNALGWLEIRSFLAAEGKLLFAEQELPTLWILLLCVFIAIFGLYRAFFISTNPLRSILFNGVMMLFIICFISLIRIAITGYRFENIQRVQERLLGEQRFYMRCTNHASSGKAVETEVARKDKALTTEVGAKSGEIGQENELITFISNEIKLAQEDKVGDNEEEEEEEEEQKYSEKRPLLKKAVESSKANDAMIEIKNEVGSISMTTDKFGFIDNMMYIVERKDIYPLLFSVKLNSVLAKALAGICLSAIAAVVKIFLF